MQGISHWDHAQCNLCGPGNGEVRAGSTCEPVGRYLSSRSEGWVWYDNYCNDIRKRKITNPQSLGAKTTKKLRLSSVGDDIPKVAHIIWLSSESGGSAPSERMLNIISLGKQIKSSGWNVKLWTNKPIVIERAALGVGLPDESPYRGVQLETGVRFSYSKEGKRSIEVCSDKELFGVLGGINRESYINACDFESCTENDEVGSVERKRHLASVYNKYELPLLWDCNKGSNGRPEDKIKTRELPCFSPKNSDSGYSETFVNSPLNDTSQPVECSDIPSGTSVVDPVPFKRSLLDHYLLNSIGLYNRSAKSDYKRMAILDKYGGVYIDSDTLGRSIKDKSSGVNQKQFYTLSTKEGVVLANGWETWFCGDLLAARPGAWQIRHMLFDQFYWANYLDQLPYVLWLRDEEKTWRLRTVEVSPEGLKVNPEDTITTPCVPTGMGDKRLLTLRDASRFRGYFCKSIHGSSPALQKGAGLDAKALPINEQKESLRYLLTIHSPGPMTVGRMVDSYYPDEGHRLAFDKVAKSRAHKLKDLKDRTVLSVTKWGELARVATVSWDKPELRPAKSFEDGEAVELLLSWRDAFPATGLY